MKEKVLIKGFRKKLFTMFLAVMLIIIGLPPVNVHTEFGYGITEEYLDYLNKTNSNDLMFTNTNLRTGVYDYERVTNEFTDLDAYYVGLIDQCDTVNEWGLVESEHVRYGK